MRPVRFALASTIALVLSACSSSADVNDAGSTPESTTPSSSSQPAEPTSTSTSTSTSASASTSAGDSNSSGHGSSVSGTGYSVTLPDGWEDVIDVAKQTNAAADVALAEPQASGEFRMNFNVVEPNPIAASITDQQLAAEAARQLKTVTKAKVVSVDGPDFDGASSLGQTSEATASTFTVTLVQYLVRHNDQLYATTMTFETKRSAEAKRVLDGIVNSWTWE